MAQRRVSREDRRATAYVDLLELVEREGLRLDTTVGNLRHSPPDPVNPKHAPTVEVLDRATAQALVAAFASHRVK